MRIKDIFRLIGYEMNHERTEWISSVIIQFIIYSMVLFLLVMAGNVDNMFCEYIRPAYPDGFEFELKGFTEKDIHTLEKMGFQDITIYEDRSEETGILNDLDNIWLYKLTAIMNGRDIWSAKLDMILSIIFFVQFVFGTIGILMLLLMFNNISNSIAMKLDWRKKYIDMLMAIGCTQSICKKIYYGFFWFRNGMAYMAAIGWNSIWLTFMNQIMDKHIGITIENRYTSLNLVIEIGIVGSVIVLGLLLRQWGKVQWTEKIR